LKQGNCESDQRLRLDTRKLTGDEREAVVRKLQEVLSRIPASD